MRKITLALVAFMLVLGMTQCKKEQQPNNTPTADGETVYITMKVTDNGDKHIVYPGTGAVVYSNGDVIYVGNNGKYVGKLTYANGTFSGSITNPSTSDYLHFYFTGGKTPATAPTAGSTTSFTVDISDQSSKLPVLSYGHSTTKYIDGTTAYTCMLENKCALVKFNVTTSSTAATCITGFKNKVTINFSNNTLTNSQENNGVITLPVGNGEKWAILLPQSALEAGTKGSAYSVDNYFNGNRSAVPEITVNGYLTDGIVVTVNSPIPTGIINGLFAINSNGDKVYFSKGNLQYQASTGKWQFAEHQYDRIGSDNENISSTYDGWIDLFGWGTSGWNNGNVYYQPYDYSSNPTAGTTGYGYGPTDGSQYYLDLTGSYANADWGVYNANAIINGGMSNPWRTLTKAEWEYVKSRPAPSYAKAQVNGVKGLILFPDDCDQAVIHLIENSYNNGEGLIYNNDLIDFTVNTIPESVWTTMEETYGLVFLPITGYRSSNSYVSDLFGGGNYWSSTSCHWISPEEVATAYYFYFNKGTNVTTTSNYRHTGRSVRLVQNVE